MKTTKTKRLRILFDGSPMLVNRTGIAYYIERLVVQLAKQYPDELELTGFYYNFLARQPVEHLPKLPNLHWHRFDLIPSKIIYQLRRWGIEVPVELLAGRRGDFILFPNFLSYPSLFKTPSAPVVHDTAYMDWAQYVSPKNGSDIRRFVPLAIQRSAFVITVSEAVKARVAEVYHEPLDHILVTPIPPAPTSVVSAAQCADLLRDAGVTKPFILFVGTIDPRKNIIGLIDGYLELPASLQAKYPLVIAGRIERFAQAEATKIEAVRAAGHNIVHLGYISDELKQALYQSATIFAHASRYEGFGMPLLEAMEHGVPCVVSDIPVFREVGGDAALYFDYHKPKDIAKQLATVLNDRHTAKTLGAAGHKRAASFTWEKVAASVYERIRAALEQQSAQQPAQPPAPGPQ